MTIKKIFAISGSTRLRSSNSLLIQRLQKLTEGMLEFTVFEDLATLPHFNPDLDHEDPPKEITGFRKQVEAADGIIICTPEYVFSMPGSLKNALEWCVSTVIFSGKPAGLITASASGLKGQEELALVMKTLGAAFTDETNMLIQGIRGKMNPEGEITDAVTADRVNRFLSGFNRLVTAG